MIDLKQYPTRNKFHRFLLRIKKQIFVPERYLIPVKRDGFYHRLLEPGYNTFWRANEELVEPISMGMRFTDIKAHPVQTKDRTKILLDVCVRFKFDPRGCDLEAISWIFEKSPRKMLDLVAAKLEEAVQAICGQCAAEELASGNNWPRYNREIQLYLSRKMGSLGILFPLTDAVVIKNLQMPKRLADGFEDGVSAAIYNNLTESQNRTLIKREVVRNSDSVRFSYFESDSNPPNIVIDMPYDEPLREQRQNGRAHA